MVNRFLMQCSKGFRLFVYATCFVVGMRAVLPAAMFDDLAFLWSLLTIAVAVVGSWRNGFWKAQAASAIPLIVVCLLDPQYLLSPFAAVFVIGAVLSAGAMFVALAMGPGAKVQPASKPVDDAVVSVVPNVSNANATAADVLARFGLNEGRAQ